MQNRESRKSLSLSRAEVERFVEDGFVRIEAAFRVVWLKKDGRLVTPEDDSTPGVLNDRTADGVP